MLRLISITLSLMLGMSAFTAVFGAEGDGEGTVVKAGKDVVEGVREAGGEVGGFLVTGGNQIASQTRSLWADAVLPMFQRITAALPMMIKAVLLLVAFWLVANLAAAGISRLLRMTRLDNRAAREWGIDRLLKSSDGTQSISIEKLIGDVVKWVIMLFGLLAFFNALELDMVARPLEGIVNRIVEIVPSLLQALVILVVYWAVASLVRMAVTRGLGAVGFDHRAARYIPAREVKGEMVGPSVLFGRLAFYVILLFGIPPFLQALGQESLVRPLQDMLAKALAFLPNVFAAGIILAVGYVVATIIREVVSNFLAAVGADRLADKTGLSGALGNRSLSGVGGTIVYFFVLIPLLISAVDALQIKAISDPVINTLNQVLAAVPKVLVAVIILAIGFVAARVVKRLVESFLSGIGFDGLPDKIGLGFLAPKHTALSAVAGAVVMAVILLLTAQQALASIGFAQLAGLVDELVRYLPSLVVGLVILFAALSLGAYVGNLVAGAAGGSGYGKLLSAVAKYAIMFLGVSMALEQMNVSREIVITVVTAVLGALALALGLAFGLGGKDRAKKLIEKQQ